MRESKRIKVHCNSCAGPRWHFSLFKKTQKYEEEIDENGAPPYYEHHTYTLVECCGCENITLIDDVRSNSAGGTYIEYFPPLASRKEPKWLTELLFNEQIDNPFKYEFIKEIYIALKNDMPRLAVMGIRALLEQVMVENIGDNGSFNKNIKKFGEKGYISKAQMEVIEPVLEAGHASIHRGFKAPIKEVSALMDITENIIESIYINQLKVKDIDVPKRK